MKHLTKVNDNLIEQAYLHAEVRILKAVLKICEGNNIDVPSIFKDFSIRDLIEEEFEKVLETNFSD